MGNADSLAPGLDAHALLPAARLAIAAGLFAALLVTLEPFPSRLEGAASAGHLVNQLGYGFLAAAAIAAHLVFTPPAVLRTLMRPAWMALAAVLVLSGLNSPWPDAALRAALFTLAAMVTATAVLCLPPDAAGFRRVLAVAAFCALGLSYAGVLLLPGEAIHGAGGVEPQHAGLWRGIYSHKNVAGLMMSMLVFAGLYLLRSGERLAGLAICVLSALFVWKTGSKTSLALLPAVACLVVGGRILGGRALPALLVALSVSGMALMTLGTALSPTLYDLLQRVLPGTTFTGRLDLWRFALGVLGDRGWTGVGFESFWTRPLVRAAEVPIELSWDPRGIVNAHNGFLDAAIALGWPGLALTVLTLLLLPLRDFVRAGGGRETDRLADLFLMILCFALLSAFLESFFFARANPLWILTWLSVVGLRLLARRGGTT